GVELLDGKARDGCERSLSGLRSRKILVQGFHAILSNVSIYRTALLNSNAVLISDCGLRIGNWGFAIEKQNPQSAIRNRKSAILWRGFLKTLGFAEAIERFIHLFHSFVEVPLFLPDRHKAGRCLESFRAGFDQLKSLHGLILVQELVREEEQLFEEDAFLIRRPFHLKDLGRLRRSLRVIFLFQENHHDLMLRCSQAPDFGQLRVTCSGLAGKRWKCKSAQEDAQECARENRSRRAVIFRDRHCPCSRKGLPNAVSSAGATNGLSENS